MIKEEDGEKGYEKKFGENVLKAEQKIIYFPMEGDERRGAEEEKSKSTCSDEALMVSVVINILSLFLTIGVVMLVVTLMLAMAADSDLSFPSI